MENDLRIVNIEWREGTAAPVSRVLHTAVLLNGVIYVGGCYHDAEMPVLHRIDIYHVATDSWDKSPIITPYRYFAMTTLNNRLITAGGRDSNNQATDMMFTLENGASELKEYGTMIIPKYSVAAASHQAVLIIAGGRNSKGDSLASTEVLDSVIGQWHVCNPLPQPCSWSQLVIVSHNLYLIGGYSQAGNASSAVYSSPLDSIKKYQLKWTSFPNLPWWLPASVSSGDGDLIILGGLKMVKDSPVRTSNIYMFNKDNHNWEVIGHIPVKRGAPAAVAAENKIIVIGGRSSKGNHTNTVWIGLCEP